MKRARKFFVIQKFFLFRKFVLIVFLSLFCTCFGYSLYLLLMRKKQKKDTNVQSMNYPFSNFGENNYQCFGTCYCNDFRRNSGVTGISKQVFTFLTAITSLMAIRLARDDFRDECMESLYSDCSIGSIESEVEDCAVESSSDDEDAYSSSVLDSDDDYFDGIEYRCVGKCRPKSNREFNERDEYDCFDLEVEDYVDIGFDETTQSQSAEYLFRKNRLDRYCEKESFSEVRQVFKSSKEVKIEQTRKSVSSTSGCTGDENSIECSDSSRKSTIRKIKRKFSQISDPERKKNTEKYFKGVGELWGVTAKEVREKVFKPVYEEDVKSLPIDERLELAFKLLESPNLDEKKFGVLILKKNVKAIYEEGEGFIENFFDRMELVIDEFVYDWGTADTLAGQVFDGLLKASDGGISSRFEVWKDSRMMNGEDTELSNWRQRIACVSFVKTARFGEFNDEIIEICETCVKNDFRFTQLGVGWVLRELSLNDLDRVVEFIKENYGYFSREGLRYAIEKMEPGLRKELLNFGKNRKN